MAPLTPNDKATEEDFRKAFATAGDGDVVFEGDRDGHHVTLKKIDGQAVVDTKPQPTSPQEQEGGFCHAAAMAAVLAIGAAGFAFLAATGGGPVMGFFVGARAAGQISAALAGGGGVSALVSQYIC